MYRTLLFRQYNPCLMSRPVRESERRRNRRERERERDRKLAEVLQHTAVEQARSLEAAINSQLEVNCRTLFVRQPSRMSRRHMESVLSVSTLSPPEVRPS
jgi:hypothetical protein